MDVKCGLEMVAGMDRAWSPLVQRPVYASDDPLAESKHLVCPNPRCEAPVVLRRRHPNPYFAHKNGKADPECDLYAGKTRVVGTVAIEEPPLLYLTLDSDGEIPWPWSLELRIKRPSEAVNGLLVIDGWDGQRNIPLSTIPASGGRIRVRPQAQYVASFGTTGNFVLVDQDFSGLPDKEVAVFRHAPNGGRMLTKRTPLFSGEGYMLLWSLEHSVSAIPFELSPKPLQTVGNWAGVYIQIPITPTSAMKQWIERCLERTIVPPGISRHVVYPPLISGDAVDLGLREVMVVEVDNPSGDLARLWVESDRQSQQTAVTHFPSTFFLEFDESGTHQVFLDEDDHVIDVEVGMESTQFDDVVECPTVTFDFRHEDRQISYSIDHATLPVLLGEAAEHSLELVGIGMPAGTSLTLYILKDIDRWISETFTSDQLDELCYRVDGLLNRGIVFHVDGGEFGSVMFGGAKASTELGAMSQRWRARCLWLTSLGRGIQNDIFRIRVESLLDHLIAEDQALLRDLAFSYRFSLEPLYRQLLNEIQCAFTD